MNHFFPNSERGLHFFANSKKFYLKAFPMSIQLLVLPPPSFSFSGQKKNRGWVREVSSWVVLRRLFRSELAIFAVFEAGHSLHDLYFDEVRGSWLADGDSSDDDNLLSF